MTLLKYTRVAAVVTVGMILSGLASCSSDQSTPVYGYIPPDPYGEVHTQYRTDQTATAQEKSDTTRSASAADGQTFYFPTGDRDSSVVQLRIAGPRQVQLGKDFAYSIEVTNLTKSPLANVVVRHVRSESGGYATEQPVLGYTEPAGNPAQNSARKEFDDDPEMKTQPPVDKGTKVTQGNQQNSAAPRTSAPPPAAQPQPQASRQFASMQNQWNLGHFKAGETKSVRIEGTASEIGMVSHCLTVDFSPLACTTFEVINPQLALTKRGPEQALICDDIEYTYVVRNTGNATARNVRVVETLPAGVTTREGQREISIPVGEIAAGQSREVRAKIRPSQGGELATKAVAQSDMGASEPATFTTMVQQPALEVQVKSPEWVYPGQPANLEIVVTNTGNGPAVDTVIDFNARGMTGDFKSRNLGRIEPGGNKRLSVPLTFARAGDAAMPATEGAAMNFNVMARAHCVESVTKSASLRMRTLPALLLETVDQNDPVLIGQNATYQIAVRNQGTGPARNVRLSATLPDGLEFVSSTGDSRIRADGKKLQFEPIASLAPGATLNWTVTAKAVKAGMTQFELQLMSDDLDEPAIESEPTRLFDPNQPAEGGSGAPSRPTPNQPSGNQPR